MLWNRTIVSSFDLPPGKFEPPTTIIDENLDLSASLFDQHTLFSQILTMKFFDKINDIQVKRERKLIRIKSALRELASDIVNEAITAATGMVQSLLPVEFFYHF